MAKKPERKRSIHKRKTEYVVCKCIICKSNQNGYKLVSKAMRTRHRRKDRRLTGSPVSVEEENKSPSEYVYIYDLVHKLGEVLK